MGKRAIAIVAAVLCAACGKKATGVGKGGVVDDGPPPPAWDWWKAGACPDGGTFHEVKLPKDGGRTIECRKGDQAEGPGAVIVPGRITVGRFHERMRVGRWPVFDDQGAQLEARTFAADEMVYASVFQDGAPLVAHTSSGCDSDEELMKLAGKQSDGEGVQQCLDRYAYFPGVVEVGVYAPDAGCVDNVWIVDCARAKGPPGDKDLLARAGWARAKGPARERLAMEYVGQTADRTSLDDDVKAVAAPDGAVVIDGWASRTEGGEAPIEIREHVRVDFAPDGAVTFKTLEEKQPGPVAKPATANTPAGPLAWDWWKAKQCPDGTTPAADFTGTGTRYTCGDDGPAAFVDPDVVRVGMRRGGDREGVWTWFDKAGAPTEIDLYAHDIEVWTSPIQDGQPLVPPPTAATECDTHDGMRKVAGMPMDVDPRFKVDDRCFRRMPLFGVAEVGGEAPGAGCVGNVWVVDCKLAKARPTPHELLARAGWAKAKGPIRARLARAYLGDIEDIDDAKVEAQADGTVRAEGTRTDVEPREPDAPVVTKKHMRWTFAVDGSVASKVIP